MPKLTHKERLLRYLQDNGSITPMEAWNELGIYRLSAEIFKLRKEKWNIKTEDADVKNRFGEPCRVANYVLKPVEHISESFSF